MLNELKFVQGVVGKKELVSGMTHFRIENSRVTAFNGKIALSAPINFDIDCTPKAATLVKAILQCEEAVQLGMTKAGKLSIKSGKFRSYVECLPGAVPHPQPDGEYVDLDGETLLDALSKLRPLIADDAARPWANGVLFDGQSAFATNNVILAEYWLGCMFSKRICIPLEAVKEFLRIKKAPVRFQMTDAALTAHYEDGTWLRTNLIAAEWPDIRKILDRAPMANLKAIPEAFFTGLNQLKTFTDDFNRVTFTEGIMRTHAEGSEEGAMSELSWLTTKGTFSLPMLLKLESVAKNMDLSVYPEPAPWTGEGALRGVVLGMRWIEENIQ